MLEKKYQAISGQILEDGTYPIYEIDKFEKINFENEIYILEGLLEFHYMITGEKNGYGYVIFSSNENELFEREKNKIINILNNK